jgi:L-amino acid N-acyltransferase YncA
MDVPIREVRPEDAEAIVGILNPIIEAGAYRVLDAPLTVDAERRYIRAFPARGIFHVAEDRQGGNLVGFQTMEPFATYTHAFDHVGVIATFVALGPDGLSEARLPRCRDRPKAREIRSAICGRDHH